MIGHFFSKRYAYCGFLLLMLWPSVEFKATLGAISLKHAHDPVLADTAETGQFSVLTYNIAGLPEIISSAQTERASSIAEIGKRLNRFDIVHVQEDFHYNKELYLSGNAHPYRSESKGSIPFGDGLNTLSRYPLSATEHISWDDCTGADCLTPKGFTFSRVQIGKELFIEFYNIHSNAFNDPEAAAARRKNIEQLSTFIKENSAGNAVIVMGDLNGRYHFSSDNIQELLIANSLRDAWIMLENEGLLPAASPNIPPRDILNITEKMESIDKIMFRSSDALELFPAEYALQSELFEDQSGKPLSDHLPVGLTFNWKLKHEKRSFQYVTNTVSRQP
ncbi:endonuclease/exonuclease/phosphatase family protein [Dyadobacter sp. CY343]|uniref:endonuclease/exonuclease/phosphatase family protein n=1 Tax=Dyadobacter sp. CY343 TaxID=2907299 RepID=UPI001F16FFEA|nr:endonuclease/exonuclease/phosphatase family protein [Dyadobacter sp. CY343]MCE7062133.1 endonuclease [Dyadobacter sp. CY343]